jgi:hypothetical protein
MTRVIAVLLSVLLLSANTEYWTAVFESHEHISCESAKHHIHSESFDCEHAELYYATKAFLPTEVLSLPMAPNYKELKFVGSQRQYSTPFFASNPKRGPPVLC